MNCRGVKALIGYSKTGRCVFKGQTRAGWAARDRRLSLAKTGTLLADFEKPGKRLGQLQKGKETKDWNVGVFGRSRSTRTHRWRGCFHLN